MNPVAWNYWKQKGWDFEPDHPFASIGVGPYQTKFSTEAKQPYWSANQAAAVSFGMNLQSLCPERFEEEDEEQDDEEEEDEKEHWNKGTQRYPSLPADFRDRYLDLRKRIIEAQSTKELPELLSPAVYLAWAQIKQIDLPPDLITAVQDHESTLADRVEEIRRLNFKIMELKKENATLRYALDVANANSQEHPPREDLFPKERTSFLKLILGMAIGGYGFEPNEERSQVTSVIETDLRTNGVPLDKGTVKKWLKEGAALRRNQ